MITAGVQAPSLRRAFRADQQPRLRRDDRRAEGLALLEKPVGVQGAFALRLRAAGQALAQITHAGAGQRRQGTASARTAGPGHASRDRRLSGAPSLIRRARPAAGFPPGKNIRLLDLPRRVWYSVSQTAGSKGAPAKARKNASTEEHVHGQWEDFPERRVGNAPGG